MTTLYVQLIEFIMVQKFKHHRACWYVVFEVDLSRENLSNANLSAEHVEENLSKVNLSAGKANLSASKENLSKENLSVDSWIIPPSLRNNGLHCVFVQVRQLVGDFISRVPFSLHGELFNISHLKQGNGVLPCKAYASSHNGVIKKSFLNIWMDVFGFCYLQVVLLQQWCIIWSKYIENWM